RPLTAEGGRGVFRPVVAVVAAGRDGTPDHPVRDQGLAAAGAALRAGRAVISRVLPGRTGPPGRAGAEPPGRRDARGVRLPYGAAGPGVRRAVGGARPQGGGGGGEPRRRGMARAGGPRGAVDCRQVPRAPARAGGAEPGVVAVGALIRRFVNRASPL